MSRKKTRVCLDLKTKVTIIKKFQDDKSSIKEILKVYSIGESTFYRIIKEKEKVLSEYNKKNAKKKKNRSAEYPDLEECLAEWIKDVLANNIPVDGKLIKEKALEFAALLNVVSFNASNGWFDGFKKRNCLAFKQISGESKSVPLQSCEQWKEKLQELLENYEPRNVFNADEAALFFKCTPDKTYTFKGEDCHGGKHSKERITVLFCANMDGSEKLPMLIIGKSKRPHCFKGE